MTTDPRVLRLSQAYYVQYAEDRESLLAHNEEPLSWQDWLNDQAEICRMESKNPDALRHLADLMEVMEANVPEAELREAMFIMQVHIPGTVTAVYDAFDSTIVKIGFTPHAGDAGYFGVPAAVVIGGQQDLDVEDVDDDTGFWGAIRDFLASDDACIRWEE